MKKPDIRSHNLQVKQKYLEESRPANDGYSEPLTDTSNQIRVGITNGKEGSVSTKEVGSYSKSHD